MFRVTNPVVSKVDYSIECIYEIEDFFNYLSYKGQNQQAPIKSAKSQQEADSQRRRGFKVATPKPSNISMERLTKVEKAIEEQ